MTDKYQEGAEAMQPYQKKILGFIKARKVRWVFMTYRKDYRAIRAIDVESLNE